MQYEPHTAKLTRVRFELTPFRTSSFPPEIWLVPETSALDRSATSPQVMINSHCLMYLTKTWQVSFTDPRRDHVTVQMPTSEHQLRYVGEGGCLQPSAIN